MTSVREASENHSREPNQTVFRCDYPDAVVGEWAVFWEVSDEETFRAEDGQPDDPTEVSDDAWLAVSESAVVLLDEMQ